MKRKTLSVLTPLTVVVLFSDVRLFVYLAVSQSSLRIISEIELGNNVMPTFFFSFHFFTKNVRSYLFILQESRILFKGFPFDMFAIYLFKSISLRKSIFLENLSIEFFLSVNMLCIRYIWFPGTILNVSSNLKNMQRIVICIYLFKHYKLNQVFYIENTVIKGFV